jgi:hypothetical protein
MTTKTVVTIGPQTGGELTGTGDSRLFELLTSPMSVDQINKSTGAALSNNVVTGFTAVSIAYAFSFWGGDFYIYSAPGKTPDGGENADGGSTVIRFSPATNTIDLEYIVDVGFAIVGAGATTCAPVVPPQ